MDTNEEIIKMVSNHKKKLEEVSKDFLNNEETLSTEIFNKVLRTCK